MTSRDRGLRGREPRRSHAGRRPGPVGPTRRTPHAGARGSATAARRRDPRRCRPCAGSPSAPGSRSGRRWSSTRAACGCRTAAIAAEAVAAELERLDRGLESAQREAEAGRGRGPPAARPAVCRHPRGPRPDDRRPDPAPRRPAPDRARPDRRRARRQRGARRPRRPARTAWPTRTWPPAPPTSATSSSGSSASSRASGRDVGPGRAAETPTRAPGARPLAQRDGRARPGAASWASPPRRAAGPATRRSSPRRWRSRRSSAWAGSSTWPGTAGWSIIDGDEGLVVLDPDAADPGPLPPGRRRAGRPVRGPGRAGRPARPRRSTATAVGLWGNIEFPGEVAACLERGADGRRALPDRVPLPQRRPAADRGGAVRGLRGRGPRRCEGRPVTIRTLDLGADKLVVLPAAPATPSRTRSLGPAEPPALAPRPGAVPDPAPGDPPGQRPGRRPGHVPPGLDPGRVPPGPRDPRRRRRRADRRGGRRSAPTCRSASWSRCPPPPSWPTNWQRRWTSSRSEPTT